MKPISNAELAIEAIPDLEKGDADALMAFARTLAGYELWYGVLPVQRITDEVATAHRSGTMPSSLTLLRTALFGEARAERFVDYGGFGDDPAGWDEHHRYMWQLVASIRDQLTSLTQREDEHEFAHSWLNDHDPLARSADDGAAPREIAGEDLAAAIALTARLLERDQSDGLRITEARMRDRLARALGHLTEASIEAEGSISIPEFRGVGPVDIVARGGEHGPVIGLIECKWSVDTGRDKIYEAAWDAIKLALAMRTIPGATGFLVTGAPAESWDRSEVSDLFEGGETNMRGLWARPLSPRGSNGGGTVGADCEAGGHGNMFTHAPEALSFVSVAVTDVGEIDTVIKSSAVVASDLPLVEFAAEPEFPQRIDQRWRERHVPTMGEDTYGRLLTWLGYKRWTEDELRRRVYPLRSA